MSNDNFPFLSMNYIKDLLERFIKCYEISKIHKEIKLLHKVTKMWGTSGIFGSI